VLSEHSEARKELAAQAESDVILARARAVVTAAERDLHAAEGGMRWVGEGEEARREPLRRIASTKSALLLANQAESRAVAKAQRDMEARAHARIEAARLIAMSDNDRAMEEARVLAAQETRAAAVIQAAARGKEERAR
jgi:hypothetical protein